MQNKIQLHLPKPKCLLISNDRLDLQYRFFVQRKLAPFVQKISRTNGASFRYIFMKECTKNLHPLATAAALIPRQIKKPSINKQSSIDGKFWCGRWDLNPHALRHTALNRARLPIPPRPQLVFFPHLRLILFCFSVAYICVRAFVAQSSALHLRKKSGVVATCLCVVPFSASLSINGCGTGDRGRTDTMLPPLDFESSASANSATPAQQSI